MTSSSSLGAVAEVREPVRGRNLSKVQIRWSDPDPSCDCFAPAPHKCECVSRAGRKRRHHSYVHESRAGVRCAFCDRIRPFDPL
jgi:hypothetical protein